jgi:hypothetical protein
VACEDFKLEIFERDNDDGSRGDRLCHSWLHTSFLPEAPAEAEAEAKEAAAAGGAGAGVTWVLERSQLDKWKKQEKFPSGFRIELTFQDLTKEELEEVERAAAAAAAAAAATAAELADADAAVELPEPQQAAAAAAAAEGVEPDPEAHARFVQLKEERLAGICGVMKEEAVQGAFDLLVSGMDEKQMEQQLQQALSAEGVDIDSLRKAGTDPVTAMKQDPAFEEQIKVPPPPPLPPPANRAALLAGWLAVLGGWSSMLSASWHHPRLTIIHARVGSRVLSSVISLGLELSHHCAVC